MKKAKPKSRPKAAAKTARKAAAKTAHKAGAKPAREAVAKPASKPARKPASRSAAKPVPAKRPAPNAAPKTARKPAPKPVPKPAPRSLAETRYDALRRAGERNPDGTALIMLGTGMPRPDPACFGPATAVVVGKRVFLFDAGAGVMRRIAAAGLSIRGPEAVFITHLHSDHTLGYPDLILTTWVMGRRTKLQAYGPVGLKKMTRYILTAWSEDIHVRIEGLERQTKTGYKVDVHEFETGVVYDHDGVRVTAIPVEHGCWKQAYGFRIDTPDRSIVISGDTRPTPGILEAARGVDVLVHEVYPQSGVLPELRVGGEVWPSYMREFHTSDVELGVLAAEAKPKMLVLHHIVRRGESDEELLASIRAGGYEGDVVVARDLDRY